MRFDEIELATGVPAVDEVAVPVAAEASDSLPASRFRRLCALLTDLSLLAALGLALWPLLPAGDSWLPAAALGGFVILVSLHYLVGSWMLWGRTVGGVIFDVCIRSESDAAIPLRDAVLRWLGLYLSLLTGGFGFLFALLPSRRSLADRMSHTRADSATTR